MHKKRAQNNAIKHLKPKTPRQATARPSPIRVSSSTADLPRKGVAVGLCFCMWGRSAEVEEGPVRPAARARSRREVMARV